MPGDYGYSYGGYGGQGSSGSAGPGGTYGNAGGNGTGNSGGGGGGAGGFLGGSGGTNAVGGGAGGSNGYVATGGSYTGTAMAGNGVAGGKGAAGSGDGGGGGGEGGYGLVVQGTSSTFSNSGSATGGAGGAGGKGGSGAGTSAASGNGGGAGGEGGDGGAGGDVQTPSVKLSNTGTFQGGMGGAGGAGGAGGGAGTTLGAAGNSNQGGAGGYGLWLSKGDSLTNSGKGNIYGGVGGAGGKAAAGSNTTPVYGGGGQGGFGVVLYGGTKAAIVNENYAKIVGGQGGVAFNGGDGGAGVAVGTSFHGGDTGSTGSFTNEGAAYVAGGAGGQVSSGVLGGSGGGGGEGVAFYGRSFQNSGTAKIAGGAGGSGVNLTSPNDGGTGGQGGAGVYLGASTSFTNSAAIVGGKGGAGGNRPAAAPGSGGPYTAGKAGGAGGDGIDDGQSGATISNSGGAITGGAGATGGSGNQGGAGGVGGIGIYAVSKAGGTTTIDNTTSITGGAGGAGGSGAQVTGAGAAGGAGIVGANLIVVNQGSISGGTSAGTAAAPDAITFTGGGNTLALGASATFGGALDIKAKGTTLTFDQSKGTGLSTNASLSSQIIGAGAIIKAGAGTLTLSDDSNNFTGGTTINDGTVDDAPGTAQDNALGTGPVTFAGASGSTATLELASNAQPASQGTFGDTLDNFDNGYDQLDLANLKFTNAALEVETTNGTVKLIVNENNTVEDFTLGGTTANYAARDDGAGGTLVYVICFASGTRIRTRRGQEIVDVAVEDLQVGERVVTASGAERPVKWLGHRTMDCRRHPSPREAHPVRIRAHAFGPNRPARDLFLSPGHSVCVDFFGETLVPVGRLANGATIAQVEVDAVTYWHVELDAHDIILAENLPCESYIDCSTRAFFAESNIVDLAGLPDAPVLTTDDYCRPFHPEGALVDFARERLCLRANDLGWQLEVTDPLAGLWLEVDGQRVVPHCDGLVARITLPAAVRDIRLCSDSAVPAAIHGARDERRLGLQLAALVADDGLHWRHEMPCTDERLVDGFHPHEGILRWTDGRARLPSELWAGARDMFVLRLAFAGPALPRWVAPAAAAEREEVVAA